VVLYTPWEIRDVLLDASGEPLGEVVSRLPWSATNALEAMEEAWARMSEHSEKEFPVEGVIIVDSREKVVAAVTKADIVAYRGAILT
jgi:hypothetical protein